MGGHSNGGAGGSGSCTGNVFAVGLGTGVPWTGGEAHGEPRGDTLEGGKPERDSKMFTPTFFLISVLFLSLSTKF